MKRNEIIKEVMALEAAHAYDQFVVNGNLPNNLNF